MFFYAAQASRRPAYVFMARLRHHIQAQVLGLFPQLSELTLLIFVAISSSTPFPRRCVLCEHVIDNCSPLVGGGCRGCGRPAFPPHTAQKGSEIAGAGTATLGRQAPGATGAIWHPSTASGAHLATAALMVRTAP
jgi:hypothetical protein